MKRSHWITYAIFLMISVGGGLLIGANNIPGPWYQSLAKPSFTPPNWLFAPAWTILYILIGIVGARVFRAPQNKDLFGIWLAQMVMNFAWSPLFFSWQNLEAAFAIILILLLLIINFIMSARQRDGLSALFFVPYALWVAFASCLNGAIAFMN
ncbi:TspO/MBR family protein [uncultured Cohaesibacter sp.]|uniref:TspO/MBR family protein n=1 Tax=uncultured Cohaesibacter sp. TaxID=1002546 RepID=UPI0029C91043|nr:TspO/MBR family protein [uncultured Cohaesibacter sp.]